MQKIVYLDNAATMPMNKKTVEKSAVFLETEFFNPSAGYSGGVNISKQISGVREYILSKLSDSGNLIFTGSATEANNYIISAGHKNKRGDIIISKGEHPSIMATATASGANIKYVGLKNDGTIDEVELLKLVDSNTALVSIFHTSNETGAINDINRLAKAVKKINPNTVFCSDGVQAFCKYDYKLGADIDLYSISAHKIGGAKGVGGLYIKKGLNLKPLLYGGGQEGGLRSGTENVYGIMSFGYAIENFEMGKQSLRNHFVQMLEKQRKESVEKGKPFDYTINGNSDWIVSISFEGLKGEIIQRILGQKGIYVGRGSACSSKIGGNKTLEAMKIPKKLVDGSIRISFGPQNSIEEVKVGVKELVDTICQLRQTD